MMDAEARMAAIKLRRLQITATLSEWKRQWLADGTQRPQVERATLEAEDAQLALEARHIGIAANEAKAQRRKIENACVLTELIAMLKERGLSALVVEATDRAQVRVAELILEAQGKASEVRT